MQCEIQSQTFGIHIEKIARLKECSVLPSNIRTGFANVPTNMLPVIEFDPNQRPLSFRQPTQPVAQDSLGQCKVDIILLQSQHYEYGYNMTCDLFCNDYSLVLYILYRNLHCILF